MLIFDNLRNVQEMFELELDFLLNCHKHGLLQCCVDMFCCRAFLHGFGSSGCDFVPRAQQIMTNQIVRVHFTTSGKTAATPAAAARPLLQVSISASVGGMYGAPAPSAA